MPDLIDADSTDSQRSSVKLPSVPSAYSKDRVAAWEEPISIDTYLPDPPSRYPAFLDSRVYQGSSGRVFPLPFHEKISQRKVPHEWDAVHLENEWVRLVILPQLGGRIYVGYDKIADYDFFYRNNVIKPALVGLAGPWLSGGVEFNWPQHHRPATFLPVDTEIEREADGSITVWCSDHDPFTRMKGMHGIRLRPDSRVIEARVRLYNRTDTVQTFLWWANVAAAVNDDYQAFFPTDVHYIADHAKRAVATYPAAEGKYYGVDYPSQRTPERPDGDRLDWYRNIPAPTSYMVTSTQDEFFGGYDHGRDAGFVHWADRQVSPGKKLWTWGDAAFGHAWDKNLTDTDGPYVELMAGVFTDNQPDFAFIAPGETKTFSQYWYPIERIGPPHQVNLSVAVSLDARTEGRSTNVRMGVSATRIFETAAVQLVDAGGAVLFERTARIAPGAPFLENIEFPQAMGAADLTLRVYADDEELIAWTPRDDGPALPPRMATAPELPARIVSVEQLFLTGQYLAQYRHATRSPLPYWLEALRRDPSHVGSNLAIASVLEHAAEFSRAEEHIRTAIARLTDHVSTPRDGEAHYLLGINLVLQERDAEAIDPLSRAMWGAAWKHPAMYALARIHARRGHYAESSILLAEIVRTDPDHLQAGCLLALTLRGQGGTDTWRDVIAEQLRRDPLHAWARDIVGDSRTEDATTLLDVALEYAQAGFFDDALRVLDRAAAASESTPLGQVQAGPLVELHRARILDVLGQSDAGRAARARAHEMDSHYCLPSRLADVVALQSALAIDPHDALAHSLLGTWLYDRARFEDAIAHWEAAAEHAVDEETRAVALRNLGIAAYNVREDAELAGSRYRAALETSPTDSKLVAEYDQLLAKQGVDAAIRLPLLEEKIDLVVERDDLTVAFANLLTDGAQAERAKQLLASRHFQPWEGGEGKVLAAWDRAHLALGRLALDRGETHEALTLVLAALNPPESLGEARHPLANTAELRLLAGDILHADRDFEAARFWWSSAAESVGDFVGMKARNMSSATVWSIIALWRLDRVTEAEDATRELRSHVAELAASPPEDDFFATSLPALLLFHDHPEVARDNEIAVLREQLEILADAAITRLA